MIEAARTTYPERHWSLCDVNSWTPQRLLDLVYSNAALQWLPDHGPLLRRLFGYVDKGGALAFQIPSATFATVRELIFEISRMAEWDDRMTEPRCKLTMETPAFYYDTLIADAVSIDLWETEYLHVLDSKPAIIDWIASTGLRPFLEALSTNAERRTFTNELLRRVEDAYETRLDGKVLFPFRRTFVIAYR